MTKMRKIELKGKVYGSTRQIVEALAWATNRRGRITWKSESNVVHLIVKYLDDHNVSLRSDTLHGVNHQVRNTMKRLVAEGYAEIAQAKPGTSYTMFRFKDDVDITGYTPMFTDSEGRVERREVGREVVVGNDNPAHVITAGPIDIPLPPAPKPARYLEDDVNKALDTWAERDAEGYAKWAETVTERLGALYG